MFDQRRNLTKTKNTTNGAEVYKRVAKEDWIQKQCTEREVNLRRDNVKNVTKQRQWRVNKIQDKQAKCLTEEQDIIGRWTEHCAELYNHQVNRDPSVLTCQKSTNDDDHLILPQEVE